MEPLITLVPITPVEQRAFILAMAGDYIDYLVERGSEVNRSIAEQVFVELEAEVEAASQAEDELWTAYSKEGLVVGWMWVKHTVEGLLSSVAFLYQILVKVEFRRMGYAGAMLVTLENVLATAGWEELRLNVWDSNEAAKRLYERAGYRAVERLEAKWQLQKRLKPAYRL